MRSTRVRPDSRRQGTKAKEACVASSQAAFDQSPASIDVELWGGWMPAEDLRQAALAALVAGGDVALNLDGIDRVDASALQILLALDAQQRKREQIIQLTNTSPHLRQWFELAGVVDRFSMTGRKGDK